MMSGQTIFVFKGGSGSCGWQILNDGVMGGLSSSSFQILPDGSAIFSGVVSLENCGGFASVWSPPVEQNFSSHDSFVLRVRGDGHRFKFSVRNESGFTTPIYRCAFDTRPGEWQQCRLPFTDFVPSLRGRVLIGALNPARVSSVGFLIADKQNGPFRLEIDLGKPADHQ